MRHLFLILYLLFVFASSQAQVIRANPFYTPSIVNEDPDILAMKAMGSSIKAQTIGIHPTYITTSAALSDGTYYVMPVYLAKGATITGIKTFMATQGNYVSDNNDKVGLYYVSGNLLNLVASCVDDATLWKATANTYITKAFSSTYVATEGLYYVVILYNRDTEVTAPKLGIATDIKNAAFSTLDFTYSYTFTAYKSAISDLPAQINLTTDVTQNINRFWIAIY